MDKLSILFIVKAEQVTGVIITIGICINMEFWNAEKILSNI